MKKGSDHRTESYWNEFGVIKALATMDNEPTFVYRIWKNRPSMTRLDPWVNKSSTLPGSKSACLRLAKHKILTPKRAVVRDRRVKTRLYQITPTIGNLAVIARRYGSPLLTLIRESTFGQGLIASSLPQYIVDRLASPETKKEASKKGIISLVEMMPKENLQEIILLASVSTRALEVALDDALLYDLSEIDKSPTFQLISAVQRLENVMLFACVAEMVASPRLKFYDNKCTLRADLNAEIGGGKMKLVFRSSFDSAEYLKNLRVGWDKAAPKS